MKKLATILCCCLAFGASAQTQKKLMDNIGPALQLGGGMNLCVIPSRNNILDYSGGSLREQQYVNMPSATLGAEFSVAVSPLQSDYFSYYFKANGSLGWLVNASHGIMYLGHEFRVGAKRLKFVIEPGKFKFRRTAFYKAEYISRTAMQEQLGRSNYENIKRLSFGACATFRNATELEIRYIREKFNFDGVEATGVYLSFLNKKNFRFYAETLLNHPVKGAYLVNVPFNELPPEGFYLRMGVTKSFGKRSAYSKMR